MNKILKWWEHVLIHINWSQFSRSSSARSSSLRATVGKVDRFSKWTWHWCSDSFFPFSYVMTFKSFISVYRCKFKKKLTLDKLYSDHFQTHRKVEKLYTGHSYTCHLYSAINIFLYLFYHKSMHQFVHVSVLMDFIVSCRHHHTSPLNTWVYFIIN